MHCEDLLLLPLGVSLEPQLVLLCQGLHGDSIPHEATAWKITQIGFDHQNQGPKTILNSTYLVPQNFLLPV